jgi:hypothetical protein
VSVVSAGCVVWLERFQPLFMLLAAAALGHQAWLIWRRPPHRRTRMMLLTFAISLGTSAAVGAALIALSFRYR